MARRNIGLTPKSVFDEEKILVIFSIFANRFELQPLLEENHLNIPVYIDNRDEFLLSTKITNEKKNPVIITGEELRRIVYHMDIDGDDNIIVGHRAGCMVFNKKGETINLIQREPVINFHLFKIYNNDRNLLLIVVCGDMINIFNYKKGGKNDWTIWRPSSS